MEKNTNSLVDRLNYKGSGLDRLTSEEGCKMFNDSCKAALKEIVGNPFVYLGIAAGFVVGMAVSPYREVIYDYVSNLF